MPRIKRIMPTGFTTVNNEFLRDMELSLAARGLLITMLSLPDGWNMSGRGLAAILPDGRDKVFSTLKVLENKGYLKRERIRENGHFVDIEYQFCDSPIFLSSNKEKNEKNRKIKKNTSSKKEKKNSLIVEGQTDFSFISPREEKREEIYEKLNSLAGGELEEYIEEKVLEKEKCTTTLNIPKVYFKTIAEAFTDLCVEKHEMRHKLSEFSGYDVAVLYEKIKRTENVREIKNISKKHFAKEKPFMSF